MHRDTVASIRSLYLRCSQLRQDLLADTDVDKCSLAELNVLISISGNFYGQGEEYSNFQRCKDKEYDKTQPSDNEGSNESAGDG